MNFKDIIIVCLCGVILYQGIENNTLKEQILNRQLKINSLQAEYKIKENKYLKDISEFERTVHELQSNYKTNINNIEHERNSCMLNSQQRSRVYKRDAEQGEAKCRALAEHTAKLDQSLSEGRLLVKELRDTIKLRDEQIINLAKHIAAGDALYE